MENKKITKGEMLERLFSYNDKLTLKVNLIFKKCGLKFNDPKILHDQYEGYYYKYEKLLYRKRRIQNLITYIVLER